MPPIRELFFTVLAIMLLAYGGILFIGGYEVGNGLPSNSSIANNYNSLVSASALPGGLFSNTSRLYGAVNNSATGVNNTGTSSSSALINSVSLVIGFMTSIPILIGAIINFVAVPLAALGIPIGYAQVIVSVFFVGIISLAIISAIFLFPI